MAPDDLSKLFAGLEIVHLPLGRVVHESGGRPEHVYFPVSCIVAMMYMTSDGDSLETALVGPEGLVGAARVIGIDTSPVRAVVQNAGAAYRAPASVMTELFETSRRFRALVAHYLQSVIVQTSQTALCSRHHAMEQQLCRWILMSIDRLGEAELEMTHELVAGLLGVRREGITDAAARLREAGIIAYTRGRIRVVDRSALENRACECYSVVRVEERKLFEHYFGSFDDVRG